MMLPMRKISMNAQFVKDEIELSGLSILSAGMAKTIRFRTLEAIYKALACKPCDT
jgi:DNA-binding Xre family transcriptional regulator